MPGRLDVRTAQAWMAEAAATVSREYERLGTLDAAIGDGDHGTNLRRGFSAVAVAVGSAPEPTTPGEVLAKAGMTLMSTVGGASGPLYGSALRALGRTLGDNPEVSAQQLLPALIAAKDALQRLGGAQPDDKTMVDAWIPAVAAFEQSVDQAVEGGNGDGGDLVAAAAAAARASDKGAEATIPLQARKGRASYLGARSIGHLDPGAVSTALLFRAFWDVVAREAEDED